MTGPGTNQLSASESATTNLSSNYPFPWRTLFAAPPIAFVTLFNAVMTIGLISDASATGAAAAQGIMMIIVVVPAAFIALAGSIISILILRLGWGKGLRVPTSNTILMRFCLANVVWSCLQIPLFFASLWVTMLPPPM